MNTTVFWIDKTRLMCVAKEGLTFGDEDAGELKRREKHYKQIYKPLTDYLKDTFKGKINKVWRSK